MKNGAEALTTDVVEAMTTNETFFFRDKIPFDHLRDTILPHLIPARANRRELRIWSAASSTGQEPYSIAMCLKEWGPTLAGWRIEIVATDLSQEVLEKSKAGIYSQFEVQRGLPIQLLVKYFKQTGELWQLNADIRGMVQHRQLNLLQDFSHLGKFDVIFCRNVLIYFDQDTKIRTVRTAFQSARAGRRADARRGGNRGRNFRRIPALSRQARALSAQPGARAAAGRRRRAAADAEGGRSALRRFRAKSVSIPSERKLQAPAETVREWRAAGSGTCCR